MIAWADILYVTFFLAAVAAIFKVARYGVDARLKRQWFYWIGIPANIALLAALLLIANSTGDEPLIRENWLRLLIGSAFVVWAVLSLLFEVLYAHTYIKIRRKEKRNGRTGQSVGGVHPRGGRAARFAPMAEDDETGTARLYRRFG